MQVVDMLGYTQQIDDLSLAIEQADRYRCYRIDGSEYPTFEEGRKRYWQDLYEKLVQLRAAGAGQTSKI